MKAQIVSFHCVLRDKVGKVISSTLNQEVITNIPDKEALLPRLAEGLYDLQKGEKRQIVLTAQEAYGFYDPELVIQVSRKKFSKEISLKIGDQVMGQAKSRSQPKSNEWRTFRITQIFGDSVTLDGNHPLAGQDLTFDLEGIEIREATSQELADSSSKADSQYFH